MRRPPLRKLACLCALVSLPCGASTHLAAARLEELSLEQLTEIRVTSVSRREERLVDAPASIYVISAEDIRRSGATRLEEVLRLAPSLQVMRTNSNDYVIGARGFNATVSNKMLVMIDGRTIYSPLFSGVFWDAQALPVEEIQRIEVISGPVATLWGSNGVNGVISITTRDARTTQGAAASLAAGNVDRQAYARLGGAANDVAYRLYARYLDGDARDLERGGDALDATRRSYIGLRGDAHGEHGQAMFDIAGSRGDSPRIQGKRSSSAAHALGRWQAAGDSGAQLQVYWDRNTREQGPQFEETLDVFDLDYQALWRPAAAHTAVWGGGYRYGRDRTTSLGGLAFIPPFKAMSWSNAFVQDRIDLGAGWSGTLGIKAETNPYTGVEWLPNARLAYEFRQDQLLWAALSRSVRAPSRLDRELALPGKPPFTLLETNDVFRSEVANVAEAGYRGEWGGHLQASLSAFVQDYPNLASVEPGATSVHFANGVHGRETGATGWVLWRPLPWWRVTGGFDVLHQRFRTRSGYRAIGGVANLANDPAYTAQLRTGLDLPAGIEADVALRHVAALPAPAVPAYTALDARLAWRPDASFELAFAVQDALDRRYAEFGDPGLRSRFGREYRILMRWAM